MISLVTYGDEKFKNSKRLLVKTAKKHGVEKIFIYDKKNIDEAFYKKNREILDMPRGGGYWLWKPYFIYRTLNSVTEGDYIIYSDAGLYFKKDVYQLIDTMKKNNIDIMPFDQGKFIEKQWTKADVFFEMDCIGGKYENTSQMWAGFMVIKKCDFTIKFIKEWLLYAQRKELITDMPGKRLECEDFIENRHDQSIYSLLVKKYNLKTFRDPSQFSKFRQQYFNEDVLKRSTYPTIVDAHRQGECGYIIQVKIKRILRWIKRCITNRSIESYFLMYK